MTDESKDKMKKVMAEPVYEIVGEPDVEAVANEELLSEGSDVPVGTSEETATADVKAVSLKDSEQCEEDTEKVKKRAKEERKNQEEITLLEKAIMDQAQEGEKKDSRNFSLTKILAGDMLSAEVLRNNIGLIVLIVVFMIVYVTNRYTAQKYLIEIDKLNTQLDDAKYKALASSSQLTEKTRESHILELLKNNKDSVLKISDRPPYIINVPE